MNLVWKLLKQNISKGQFAGFFIANLIGLTIVLLGLQFYVDINPLFSEKDTIMKRDFLVLTKQVGIYNTLNPQASGFSAEEIKNIENTSFATQVGAFIASRYKVFGGINTNQGGFNTEMFFESVPDDFIDVKTDRWKFSPDDEFVPIILPKNYLDLYNFGFAEARSMPKLSQSVIGMVNFNITISGKWQHKEFKGQIAGFSNRINTILVPESFMKWANENYGEQAVSNPSRLMVEVNNPADPNIATFLKKNNYEVEGENSAVSKMSYFLKIMVGIVIAIGIIICALAFFVLTLSIYLLLEKNMEKLRNLRLIGYAKSVVVRPYELMAIGMNLAILTLAIASVLVIRIKYSDIVRNVWSEFEGSDIMITLIAGVCIFLLLSSLNIVIIRRKVK
ncbi:ABC transporter permease [Dysgonomonas mossii]|uniref:ABC transporter permease n=1 Tax=Dysgonomonas mossii TaxID=163665 RepID=A0A4Y9IJ05_9BACT|nr:ABC transporter permease [Dysgonomonas mossii]MBF0762425.1 ABC transporter permease [Dysgonomonas mossii]TFU87092.1 ABC transporter permease [Dysgonomonas mossii]